MRKVLVIVGILLAFCCTSRADDVSAQFQVNGILTIVGNNHARHCPRAQRRWISAFPLTKHQASSIRIKFLLFLGPAKLNL